MRGLVKLSNTRRVLTQRSFLVLVLLSIGIISITHLVDFSPLPNEPLFNEDLGDAEPKHPQHADLAEESEPYVYAYDKFFENIFDMMLIHGPSSSRLERTYNKTCHISDAGLYTDKFFSEEDLLNCLQIPSDFQEDLKVKHAQFVNSIPAEFPPGFYHGQGIVMVGGGKFSIMSYLSIKMLRQFGNDLPVEVFIPPNDAQEPDFCDVLLPSLNARCIQLTTLISDDTIKKFKFKGYQYKSLALLASTFAQVLMIDADNFIMKPAGHIFTNEPFISRGLVTWPDYWKRLTSPKFYQIAGIPVSEKRARFCVDDITPPEWFADSSDAKIPFHDREGALPEGSTESGQLLIDKYKHAPTLLLSLYYNIYGPSHYYPILGQGKAGEGDKDTFLAAAHFHNLPYYQLKKSPATAGFFHKGGFKGVAMLQSDPVNDYQVYSSVARDFQREGSEEPVAYDLGKFNKKINYNNVLFVHSHLPKFDPVFLYKSKDVVNGEGKHIRMYTDTSFCNGCDFELLIFSAMSQVMCEKNNARFAFTRALSISEMNDVCEFLFEHQEFLTNTTTSA